MSVGRVLFVVHGQGRGRRSPAGKAFLERLSISDPELAGQISVHRTGSDMPDLKGCSLIVFWLGDPLQAKYPSCYEEAIAIEAEARARGISVLNPPAALNNTSKFKQSEIWQQAAVPSARSEFVTGRSQLEDAVRHFGTACILRPDAEHAQRGVTVIDRPEDLKGLSLDGKLPGVLLQVVDVRQAYRDAGTDPKSPFARFHHKARAFVIGDKVKPSHLIFSESLIVGVSNCTFRRRGQKLSKLRTSLYRIRNDVNSQVREDIDYYRREPIAAETLVYAVKTLGLNFAAVDYSIFPDGGVVLWEANPYFYLPPGSESVMSQERGSVVRVEESLDWMGQCLRSLKSQGVDLATRRIVE